MERFGVEGRFDPEGRRLGARPIVSLGLAFANGQQFAQHDESVPPETDFRSRLISPVDGNLGDAVAALEAWVEHSTPPARILASKIVDTRTVRTRPLCPFPQQARYSGSGSLDDAASFTCVKP